MKKLHKLCVWFGFAAGNFLNVFGAAPAEKRKRRERNSRARARARATRAEPGRKERKRVGDREDGNGAPTRADGAHV